MKYIGIRKIQEGTFITRYDVDYVTAEGHEKTYEMISRNPNIRTLEELQNRKPDSVILILTDESGERILVSREYRMATAQWVYNFPAGLIDPGETPVAQYLADRVLTLPFYPDLDRETVDRICKIILSCRRTY